MRILVTGVHADGRSCAAFDEPPAFAPNGYGFAFADVYSSAPTSPPPRPMGHADFIDLGLGPGVVRWILVDYDPGATTPNHQTDSIDFEVVLEGSIELILDDGAHELVAGDCIVMTGVDHAWKAGPQGCRLSALSLGTPPPD
jgi:quercetin dioxygenase-like cupin family protein